MNQQFINQLYPNIPKGNNPFGYIPETEKPNSAIYNRIFSIGGATASFDWRPYAPVRERQYWYPFCVSFSRLNCGETVANKQGIQVNLSDRELGVISGTTIYGNSLEAVSEAFRLKGVRVEAEVPFTEKMVTFAGNDIWDLVFDLPKDNGSKRYYGGNHSWVYGTPAMIDAMQFSPLQIALGIDGNWEADGVVKAPTKIEAYHAVMLMYIDVEGYMYIQDSIGKEFKKLAPDYPLTGCKSFRDLPENWKGIMAKKFIIKDGDKIGVLVCEGFTFGGGFAKDEKALTELKDAFEFNGTEPTLELPKS